MSRSSSFAESEAINLKTIDFLLSDEAAAEAERLASITFPDEATPTLLALRKKYTPEDAGALLALVRLRQVARKKFMNAQHLYFTQGALEQATADTVATYRATKLDALAPPGAVLDLGSGIGGDALALGHLRQVAAYELDEVRARLLAANAAAMELSHRITVYQQDWQEAAAKGALAGGTAAFLDPPRRAGERRLMRLAQVLPSWKPIRDLLKHVSVVCMKLMPGIGDIEIPQGARVEFISHEGSCKEAVVWLGEGIAAGREAAVHDGARWHTIVAQGMLPPTGPLQAGQVLYEPDPAVIRAGPFAELCALLDAHLFDSQIAYLVSRDPAAQAVETPLATAFRIEEVHDYSLKRLNERLAGLEIGPVELKKRGVPFEPESLRSRIKTVAGGRPAVVFFTRQEDRRMMLMARRITRHGEGSEMGREG